MRFSSKVIILLISISWALFAGRAVALAGETPKPSFIIIGDQDPKGLKFNTPTGVALGRDGDIFVTDSLNTIVQVFTRDGKFKFYLGEPGNGGGQFIIPWGITTDADGRVYVTDIAQHRIHIFDHKGKFLGQFGGVGNGKGKFNPPAAFTMDTNGNYYVVDSGNMRVQIFGSVGKFISKFGMAGSEKGNFIHPQGIALDKEGRIYVADGDKNTASISVFDTNNSFLYRWGEIGTEPGKFMDISRIAFDRDGRFYVVDTGNNRVQVFEDIEYKTAPCVTCHRSIGLKSASKYTHEPFKKEDCQQCHKRHGQTDKNYYVAKGSKLCEKCHDFLEEEFARKHELYPVGRTSCVECHDPHGSGNEHLLRPHARNLAPKEQISCISCHDILIDDTIKLKETRSKLCYICHNTKLGDAHYKVFSAAKKDCLECHVRHSGSLKDNLKNFTDALCTTADCHSSKNLLHQHLSDIYPKEDMSVPTTMPLDKDGKIICVTCHSGHATVNQKALRVAKENICALCHQKKKSAVKADKLEVREIIQLPPETKPAAPAPAAAPVTNQDNPFQVGAQEPQ